VVIRSSFARMVLAALAAEDSEEMRRSSRSRRPSPGSARSHSGWRLLEPVRASANLPVTEGLPVRADYACELRFGGHTVAKRRQDFASIAQTEI
jgi:hypothetical protein